MSDRPVLVVSTVVDLATDRVVDRLNEAGVPVVRINTEDVPYSASLSILPDASIEFGPSGGSTRRIDQPRSVWYRRLRSAPPPADVEAGVHAFVAGEASWMLRAAVEVAGADARWMSRPGAIDRAEMKPYQLHVAAELGLTVPETLITSDAGAIRGFADAAHGAAVIVKPLRHGYLEVGGVGYAMYTRRLTRADLDALDTSLPAPLILQREVPKAFDVRVTVVGDEVYAALIDSQSDPSAIVDWRRTDDPDLRHLRHELPAPVGDACRELLLRLDLAFGAIDLVLREDGAYVFIEVNPNGQWLWIEDKLDLPISDAMARWLAG